LNHLWSKTYGDINVEERNGYVATAIDGGFILASNKTPYPGPSFINQAKCYILKTDSSGTVQWQKEYDLLPNHADYLKQVKVLQDSTYLFLGTMDDTIQNAPKVLLLKTDKNGNKLWHKSYTYYGGQTQNYGEDFTISENGDIAVTGYVIPTGVAQYNDMFVLKVDSCGYLENDSIDAQFTYEQSNIYDISFTNQSQHYCTPQWYFGDGNSLYTNNPTHTYSDTGTYTVTLIVRAGNSIDTITQQVVVNGIVGIDPQTPKGGLRVYPNPATEEVRVEIQNTNPDSYRDKIKEVKVYDVAGRAIIYNTKEAKGQYFTLDIAAVTSGLYFVEVGLSNGSVERAKFIKQ
jgi:PKD repeat protein